MKNSSTICRAKQRYFHYALQVKHTHTQAGEQSEITAGGGKSLRHLQKHKITNIHIDLLRGVYKGLWQVQPKTAGLTHLQTSPAIAAAAAAAAAVAACHMPHTAVGQTEPHTELLWRQSVYYYYEEQVNCSNGNMQ